MAMPPGETCGPGSDPGRDRIDELRRPSSAAVSGFGRTEAIAPPELRIRLEHRPDHALALLGRRECPGARDVLRDPDRLEDAHLIGRSRSASSLFLSELGDDARRTTSGSANGLA